MEFRDLYGAGCCQSDGDGTNLGGFLEGEECFGGCAGYAEMLLASAVGSVGCGEVDDAEGGADVAIEGGGVRQVGDLYYWYRHCDVLQYSQVAGEVFCKD